jgi:hypothetical protein
MSLWESKSSTFRLGKANFAGDLSGKVKLSCSPLVFNCFALWPSSDELSAPAVYRRLKLRRPSDIALSEINNQAGVLAELIRDQQWEEGKRAYQATVAVLRATDSDCDVQPGYVLLFNMRRETNKLLMVLLDDEGFSAATRSRVDKQINFEQMVLLGMIRSALGDVDAGRTDLEEVILPHCELRNWSTLLIFYTGRSSLEGDEQVGTIC